MTSITENIKHHLEEQLGDIHQISSGKDKYDNIAPFEIATILHQPCESAITFTTVGLSNSLLRQPDGTLIRHELVFCTYDNFLGDDIFQLLFSIGSKIDHEKKSVYLGMLIDLGPPIIENSLLEYIFFYTPLYFPETFNTIDSIDPKVIFAWMIPVSRSEAEYITAEGYEKFDDLLTKHDPDLMNLYRESLL